MKHSFLDQYSDRDSFGHRLDPRVKFLLVLLFILCVVLTPPGSWTGFALYFGLIAGLILISRLPPGYVIKRSLLVVPFVLLIAVFVPFFKEGEPVASYSIWAWQVTVTKEGLQVLGNILVKAWLSMLGLVWLTATTKITNLLHALEKLHLPGVMVMIMAFMYRYIFVIVDETMRMRQARDSRNFGGSRMRQLRTVGNMIGTLFIRSYERSERVYTAMVSRGFDGQSRTLDRLRLRKSDAFFGISVGVFLVLTCVASLTFFY